MEQILIDHLTKLGKKGGKSTKKRYGNEHFRRIAKLRWEKVRQQKQEKIKA